jgi:hypothetical protein
MLNSYVIHKVMDPVPWSVEALQARCFSFVVFCKTAPSARILQGVK